MSSHKAQVEICRQFGAEPDFPGDGEKLGVALSTLGRMPLNGLRHARESGTCGWYIWGGEILPEEDDAFSAQHVGHLQDHCPDAIRFLGLPPGWRFLTDGDYVDVWRDQELLNG